MSSLPSFPKWIAPKGAKSPPTDAELNKLIAAREAWAAARIVGWDKRGLQPDDYDFRSWTNAVPTGVESGHFGLRFGACYEYAREGRKLRGLLLLADPERKREPWEVGPMVFAGATEDAARDILAEMFDALARLAKPLAANLSFAELWRTDRKLVEQVLNDGKFWRNMRVRHGVTSLAKLSRGAPVEVAKRSELEAATTLDTLNWGGKPPADANGVERALYEQTRQRQIKDGKEIILLRVDLANFRDEHLKEGFGDVLKRLRHSKIDGVDVPPEPHDGKGQNKITALKADLDGLSAMRLISKFAMADAIEKYEIAALIPGDGKEESNFRAKGRVAATEFRRIFHWENEPENCGTWAGHRR
jgi:hypothetical protein